MTFEFDLFRFALLLPHLHYLIPMGPVTVLYIAFASISLFASLLQLFLTLKKRGDILPLVISILSFIVFVYYGLIILYSEPSGVNYLHLPFLRYQLILTQAVLICMFGVIFYLLKDSNKLFILLNVSLISFLMILSFIIPDNLLFGNDELIYYHNINNNDNLHMIGHGFTWWRAITNMTILLFAYSTFKLLVKKSNSIGYRNIFVFFSGLGLILLTALYDQFVDLDFINSIYLLPFAIFMFYLVLSFIPYVFLLKEVNENTIVNQQTIKWRNLINAANVIVVGLNRMGHVEFINPYFYELTGYQEDEVIGQDWFEFFIPPNDYFKVQGAFIEVLEFEFHPHYSNPILTKNKEEKMIQWYNVRTRDLNGKITGSLSLGMDITESIREKDDLINKLREAEALIAKLKARDQK